MRTLPIALLALGSFVLSVTGPGEAQADPHLPQTRPPHLDVIEVVGLVDPVQVDFVTDALRAAEEGGAQALVIQLDSGGGVVSRARLDVLAFRLRHARLPVAVWVGPSGARAYGQAVELVEAAHVAGASPRARVGRRARVETADAVERGVLDLDAPTLGDFVVELDGRRVAGVELETAEVVAEPGRQPRRRPTVEVRFGELALLPRLLHTAASPSVAYLLLVAGLALVVLELYTAGVGIAAVTGAGCLVLASYGLGVLPARPYAVGLIGLGAFGYAVDVQAGTPRTWTAIGTAATAAGSLRLYRSGLSVSPLVLVTVLVGVTLLMVGGLPSMIRSRFSTPTIGRESMVGEVGQALAPVAPEGTVEVRGAPWRARTNRATPIAAGDAVRVVGIDGLLLEVEPEAGGARDHRSGGNRRSAT